MQCCCEWPCVYLPGRGYPGLLSLFLGVEVWGHCVQPDSFIGGCTDLHSHSSAQRLAGVLPLCGHARTSLRLFKISATLLTCEVVILL